MPIYEYQCEGCGHQMEAMQSIRDTPLVQCPECREDRLRKQVSAAGFRLKGSGWYVTDFRDGGNRKKEGGPAGQEATGAGESEAASKPASTSEAAPSSGSEAPASPKPSSSSSSSAD